MKLTVNETLSIVKVEPDEIESVWDGLQHNGRNGTSKYGGLAVSIYPQYRNMKPYRDRVLISKIHSEGNVSGGETFMPLDEFDALALAWCKMRGLIDG